MNQGNLARGKGTSDAALAAEAMGGCAVSLGLLFERYRPQLYAAAVSLLGYTSDADDAVHDTFVTAMVQLGQLREPAAVGGWLHAIISNRCLMEKRRHRPQVGGAEAERHFRELQDEDRIETNIENRDLRDWVSAALQKLPENQRTAVMLRYFGSYNSYDEISSILSVPVGTVRSRLFDAKVRLSEILLSSAGGRDDAHERLQAERRDFYQESSASSIEVCATSSSRTMPTTCIFCGPPERRRMAARIGMCRWTRTCTPASAFSQSGSWRAVTSLWLKASSPTRRRRPICARPAVCW